MVGVAVSEDRMNRRTSRDRNQVVRRLRISNDQTGVRKITIFSWSLACFSYGSNSRIFYQRSFTKVFVNKHVGVFSFLESQRIFGLSIKRRNFAMTRSISTSTMNTYFSFTNLQLSLQIVPNSPFDLRTNLRILNLDLESIWRNLSIHQPTLNFSQFSLKFKKSQFKNRHNVLYIIIKLVGNAKHL